MVAVVFALEGERYAIPVARIREIVQAVALARIPGAPALVEGIANVRGRLVPVLDARRRFGHTARPTALSDMLIIVDAGFRDVALHVDHVVGVSDVADTMIVTPESLVKRSPFIGGLAPLLDGTLLIHDPHAFLSEAESEAVEAVMVAGAAA